MPTTWTRLCVLVGGARAGRFHATGLDTEAQDISFNYKHCVIVGLPFVGQGFDILASDNSGRRVSVHYPRPLRVLDFDLSCVDAVALDYQQCCLDEVLAPHVCGGNVVRGRCDGC